MIVFDYSCLASDKHRRHFIDAYHPIHKGKYSVDSNSGWESDWNAYYAAAGEDRPIKSICEIYNRLYEYNTDFEIWADIPEKYREQTTEWLSLNGSYDELAMCKLKMRPDGDTTPWHDLKEKWMKDFFYLPTMDVSNCKSANEIQMVFEPVESPMIQTWKKYGVTCLEVHDDK